MSLTTPRFMLALAVACAAVSANAAKATSVTSNVDVDGNFGVTLSGGGTASLASASGTFRQWLGLFHTNINVTANPQTVGVNIPQVGPLNLPASGQGNLTFDNLTPGTSEQLNSVNLDLNGAGGSNTNIPYTINVNPIQINTSLGNFNLVLTVAGNITDLRFDAPTAAPPVPPVPADPNYAIGGDFTATLNGTVTGQLVGVPLIGTVNLGTITTIAPTDLAFEAAIPGTVSLSDLTGGLGPFPSDMLANFAAVLPFNIPVPVQLPLNVAINQTVPNGQSGFSVLNVTGDLDAELILGNPSYDLTGTVAQVLVPEPGTFVLGGLGLVGLAAFGYRRRRAA